MEDFMDEGTEAMSDDANAHPSDKWNEDELGLTTAELLGNAALGVLALVAIWALMQQLGLDIVDWIRSQLIG
jgi:hypothetical protein